MTLFSSNSRPRPLPLSALLLLISLPLAAQTSPPASPPTSSPAPLVPAVKNIGAYLPESTAVWNFSNAPVAEVVQFVSTRYGLHIVDPYKLQDRVTIKLKESIPTRDALTLLDQTLIPLGYIVTEELKGTPPALELRVTTVTRQRNIPVFTGNDPATIPDDTELRTQVLYLPTVDADKAREMISAVVDKQADVVICAAMQSLIITDAASRIRTAASLLQILEKQAAATQPGPQK